MPAEVLVKPKPLWRSKTLIANLLIALAALIPGTKEFVTGENIVYLLTGVNFILRLITKNPIAFFS